MEDYGRDSYVPAASAVCNLVSDPTLFSSGCAYSVLGPFWWRLDCMCDRFKNNLQERGPLNKWVKHVDKMISESWLATDNQLHTQAAKEVPDSFVKQYVLDTHATLMFYCQGG